MSRVDHRARSVVAFLLVALFPGFVGAVSLVERAEAWWERFWSRPPFPVLNSGYFAEAPGHPNRLYWVDNDRVIFAGDSMERGRKEIRAGQLLSHRIHIWNVRTGEVSYYGEGISPPCYFAGYIYYVTRADEQVYAYKEGPFGKEIEVSRPGHGTPRKDGERTPIRSVLDCRLYARDQLPPPRTYWTRPLLHGHGHLVIDGIGGPPRPATLIKPGSGEPVVLPLNGDEIDGNRIQYVPWVDAYLLYSDLVQRRNPAGTKPKYLTPRVVLMAPSGAITELLVPDRDWFTAGKGFIYTRAGLVLWSQATAPGGLGNSGLHLIDGAMLRTLVRGHVRGLGVSPDGCTIAVSLKTKDADPPGLRAVDLCKTGR